MKVIFEYELNRAWVNNDDGEPIGETNFVVPAKWLNEVFDKFNNEDKFVCLYDDFNDFIETYEPETDGELIYQKAIADGVLTVVPNYLMCLKKKL